jgi:hypothetical protein
MFIYAYLFTIYICSRPNQKRFAPPSWQALHKLEEVLAGSGAAALNNATVAAAKHIQMKSKHAARSRKSAGNKMGMTP